MAQKRKKGKTKAYSGYMKFPLCGAETHNEFKSSCEFFGDFADPHKRIKIFNRPRKFKMEVWLYLVDEQSYDITQLSLPDTPVDKRQLSELLKHYAHDSMYEASEHSSINLTKSFFKVII